jgi:hypothetical protein
MFSRDTSVRYSKEWLEKNRFLPSATQLRVPPPDTKQRREYHPPPPHHHHRVHRRYTINNTPSFSPSSVVHDDAGTHLDGDHDDRQEESRNDEMVDDRFETSQPFEGTKSQLMGKRDDDDNDRDTKSTSEKNIRPLSLRAVTADQERSTKMINKSDDIMTTATMTAAAAVATRTDDMISEDAFHGVSWSFFIQEPMEQLAIQIPSHVSRFQHLMSSMKIPAKTRRNNNNNNNKNNDTNSKTNNNKLIVSFEPRRAVALEEQHSRTYMCVVESHHDPSPAGHRMIENAWKEWLIACGKISIYRSIALSIYR